MLWVPCGANKLLKTISSCQFHNLTFGQWDNANLKRNEYVYFTKIWLQGIQH